MLLNVKRLRPQINIASLHKLILACRRLNLGERTSLLWYHVEDAVDHVDGSLSSRDLQSILGLFW